MTEPPREEDYSGSAASYSSSDMVSLPSSSSSSSSSSSLSSSSSSDDEKGARKRSTPRAAAASVVGDPPPHPHNAAAASGACFRMAGAVEARVVIGSRGPTAQHPPPPPMELSAHRAAPPPPHQQQQQRLSGLAQVSTVVVAGDSDSGDEDDTPPPPPAASAPPAPPPPQPEFPAFKPPPPVKSPTPRDQKGGGPLDQHIRQKFQRERHNSTGTVLVPNVIQAPDIEELVKCMSFALCYHVEKSTSEGTHMYCDALDERITPLTREPGNTSAVPSVSEVFGFLLPVFKSERLGAEICIMTLAYIERVMATKDVALLPYTWRRASLGALILASKVWEDQSVWNVDFVHCFDALTALDLTRLERFFLNLIEFNVGLKASLYVKYFLALQQYSTAPRRSSPYSPAEEESTKLELVTVGKQKEMKKRFRHTCSAGDLPRRFPSDA